MGAPSQIGFNILSDVCHQQQQQDHSILILGLSSLSLLSTILFDTSSNRKSSCSPQGRPKAGDRRPFGACDRLRSLATLAMACDRFYLATSVLRGSPDQLRIAGDRRPVTACQGMPRSLLYQGKTDLAYSLTI